MTEEEKNKLIKRKELLNQVVNLEVEECFENDNGLYEKTKTGVFFHVGSCEPSFHPLQHIEEEIENINDELSKP
ncbi:MAG: hypothetical protein H7A23_02465 [Leptospiraceae bacterium]|nr:hypothetical protein [Leptospiraceae bacterium]MCP5493395.1 hypothetical protein [Leptospiraceae bacterium]